MAVKALRPEGVQTAPLQPGESGEAVERLPGKVQTTRENAEEKGPRSTEKLMEQVAEPANLNEAWKRVRGNRGAPGIDGITVETFPRWFAAGKERLLEELLAGSYCPQPLRRHRLPKPDGGERLPGIPTVLDRLVQQAILQVLQPILDPSFSENSYGFRPNRRAHQAITAAQGYIQAGYDWVVDIDLEAFFDRVNHDRLMSRLSRRIADRRLGADPITIYNFYNWPKGPICPIRFRFHYGAIWGKTILMPEMRRAPHQRTSSKPAGVLTDEILTPSAKVDDWESEGMACVTSANGEIVGVFCPMTTETTVSAPAPKSEVLSRLEATVERLTGETAESLREHSISEYRMIGEAKHDKPLHFVSCFPTIGRGNVLRDRVISHARIEKQLSRALR